MVRFPILREVSWETSRRILGKYGSSQLILIFRKVFNILLHYDCLPFIETRKIIKIMIIEKIKWQECTHAERVRQFNETYEDRAAQMVKHQ